MHGTQTPESSCGARAARVAADSACAAPRAQVWYPDSAAKTADAIEEFAREGLPLLVLANWRGFSGGQRDLLEGVLQAGSRIVAALRAFPQPVVVYVPPRCELRGGAWVVLDTQINAARIEMFAGARHAHRAGLALRHLCAR